MLPNTTRLRAFYLSYLSSPAKDRLIYREIVRNRAREILELGIGIGQRAVRMIEAAARSHARQDIRYTAVDLFEARSAADGPGVTLKMAHRLLHATGAQVQLIPGDPFAALSRTANSLGQIDLTVVSSRLDPRQLARAWFYVPRLLHEQSAVVLEKLLPGGNNSVRQATGEEIETLSAAASSRRAA